MAYATLGELKTMLGDITDGDLDVDGQRALNAAAAALDLLTNRRSGGFEPDDAPTTRSYTAVNASLVLVDDVAEIDTVTSDGTEVTVTPEPLNAVVDGEPYTRLVSDRGFSCEVGAVAVTGIFGWPQVPHQVQQFVLIAAAKLLKRSREAPFGLVTGAFDGEVVRLSREDPDLQFLIKPLMRNTPVIA